MIPAQALMPDVLALVLQKAPLTREKIAFAWRVIVGPAVDQATTVDLQGSTLRVRAKDPAWRREVERSAALIRGRLKRLLGDDVVRSIEVELI